MAELVRLAPPNALDVPRLRLGHTYPGRGPSLSGLWLPG